MRKLSVWCKKAKIAMIRQDLTVNELAKALGRSRCYIFFNSEWKQGKYSDSETNQ